MARTRAWYHQLRHLVCGTCCISCSCSQEVEDGDSAIVVGIVVGNHEILAALLRNPDVEDYLAKHRDRLMQLALDMGISQVIAVLKEGLAEVDAIEAVRDAALPNEAGALA